MSLRIKALKFQLPNNNQFQLPRFNFSLVRSFEIGVWILFVICGLEIGASCVDNPSVPDENHFFSNRRFMNNGIVAGDENGPAILLQPAKSIHELLREFAVEVSSGFVGAE